MKTHQEIDRRSLVLANAVAAKLDADPMLLRKVSLVCARWYSLQPQPAVCEWMSLLQKPWHEIQRILVEDSETCRRLRQSSPFCGILTPQERWSVYREFYGK